MKDKNKRNKQNNHYTLMFFPEGRGNPFTLRVHRYTLSLTATAVIVLFLGILVLIYKAGEISLRLQMVHSLRQENIRLRQYAKDLEISSQKIASIDSMTAYLHKLAGIADLDGTASSAPAASVAARRPASAESPAARPTAVRRPVSDGNAFVASVPNIMPVDGWITKQFSGTGGPDSHNGVDIAAAHGTPIRATAPGVVEEIRNDRYLGLTVEIRHENGFLTRYSHCSQILVSVGDRVNRGQTIALVGSTGRSTAPHVHYETLKDGKNINPMSFIGTQDP